MNELMIVLRRIIARAPRVIRRGTRSEDILAFLTGRSGGEHVLHALYDHIAEEAVPPRLSALVSRARSGQGR